MLELATVRGAAPEAVPAQVRFSGASILTVPGTAMTPRPAAEALVDAALHRIGDRKVRVADVGTGSGAIAVALALKAHSAEIWASDQSEGAAEVARHNVRRHGLQGRVHVLTGDLLDPLPGVFETIVANLPYLPLSVRHAAGPDLLREPESAVFAPGDGLVAYRRLIEACEHRLLGDGVLIIQFHRRVLAAERKRLRPLGELLGWLQAAHAGGCARRETEQVAVSFAGAPALARDLEKGGGDRDPDDKVTPDAESRAWLEALHSEGEERHRAVARLHRLLLHAARFEIRRRSATAPHLRGDDLEDLAHQSADDALLAILAKLDDYRGKSRFTTWAYKFALLEAAVKVRRRAWQGREIPLEPERWPLLPDGRSSPHDDAATSELIAAIRSGIADLTPRQRDVLVAVAVNGVPIDVLAERMQTTRGALYKTLHDARRALRSTLAEDGIEVGHGRGART
jgi:RNA polymerase sigma-70 factor, ECF subfamily